MKYIFEIKQPQRIAGGKRKIVVYTLHMHHMEHGEHFPALASALAGRDTARKTEPAKTINCHKSTQKYNKLLEALRSWQSTDVNYREFKKKRALTCDNILHRVFLSAGTSYVYVRKNNKFWCEYY